MQDVFQSTLPRRERPQRPRPCGRAHAISIHAPAKGATWMRICKMQAAPAFQSTLPRRERRSAPCCPVSPSPLFQSTLPRRERRSGIPQQRPQSHFNPRSREGSDSDFMAYAGAFKSFQSTLPRRERPHLACPSPCALAISIHAPAKGATVGQAWTLKSGSISIHAPAKGATIQTVHGTAAVL